MIIENQTFDEERALYGLKDAIVRNCRFAGEADGESAFKETSGIEAENCYMDLRYPFWHTTNSKIKGCSMTENCRAALWYDNGVIITDSRLGGIKALRECQNITLENCSVNSPEFIWKCKDLSINNVCIENSEYPFFEVDRAKINALTMKGKYSFQYCTNILIENSNFDTKDAFWHTKDVTVKNSIIKGEYLGWYSENLTLENCRIIGTQPFCSCKNLKLINCALENCDLAFERSSVEASIQGKIDSVKNVYSGRIEADEIGEIIADESIIDKTKTEIVIRRA